MDEAIRRSASAGGNDRYINFSVDDGYRDTFEEVVPVFRRHRLPVTVFVTTGIPDGTLPLWAAGLELALLQKSQVILEGKTIDVDSAESKQAAFRAIAASWECADTDGCYRRFCELNGVDAEELHRNYAISWEMLEILREDPLVEIGAHTVSHARIAALSVADAVAEVRGSRERLSKRLDIDVRHFAFPFGRSGDCGPRDFEIARQSGFASAATTRKGLVRQNQNPFSLPRNTINGAHRSLALMESHLTGLSGFAARMIGRV
jgi:peptidoglycan/xylan/chitin deacetylase (PgdA/CDA1 family)